MPTQDEAFPQPVIPETPQRSQGQSKRVSQRGILPLATKFRLIEFYDPTTNSIKFYTSPGTLFLTINLTSGVLTHSGLLQSFSAEKTTGGTASADVENQPTEGSDEAFDGDFATKWLASATTSPWLKYQFPSKVTIKKYAITSGVDSQDRDPKSWTLEGSNDDSAWTILDTRTGEWFGPRQIRREFFLDNSTEYLYYRLNISANWGSADTQLSELEMYE